MSHKTRYLFVVLMVLVLALSACQPEVIEKEVEVVVTEIDDFLTKQVSLSG